MALIFIYFLFFQIKINFEQDLFSKNTRAKPLFVNQKSQLQVRINPSGKYLTIRTPSPTNE